MIKIIKVGGAILNDQKKYAEILRYLWGQVNYGGHIVLVVSAIGRNSDPYSTDGLNDSIKNALTVKERNRLKAIGETYAVLKVTADLRNIRLRCRSYSYRELGLTIDGRRHKFKAKNMNEHLKDQDILVVPGYIGKTKDGEPATLKREGSDFSAVIIAAGLDLHEVFLVKDMPGIYGKDGNIHRDLSYEEFFGVIENFSSPISVEAVHFAQDHDICLICLNIAGYEVGRIRKKD